MDPERLFRAAPAPFAWRRVAASLGASAAAFTLTAWALEGGLTAIGRGPRDQPLEQKWRQFERQADDCEILFLGTSRVYRNLDPAAFEEALYEQGLSVRSFNLGLPRMSILEAEELAERLAARRPDRLKIVVMEPTLFVFDQDNRASEREMAMHDWRGTRLAVSNTLGAECRRGSAWLDRWRHASPHALSFACRSFNLGLAAPLVFPPLPQKQSETSHAGNEELAGFGPLPVLDDRQAAWRERFRRFLALPQPPDWRGAPLSDEELDYFQRLLARIRRAGAEPVLLVGPRVKRDSHTVAVLESRSKHFASVPLVDYLRGRGEETLYQIDYWHDFDHLNAVGARELSKRVARDLAPLLSSGARQVTVAHRQAREGDASAAANIIRMAERN